VRVPNRFWFRCLTIFSSFLLANPFPGTTGDALTNFGFCFDFGTEVFIFTIGKVYTMYNALREDSMYWQGVALQPSRFSRQAKAAEQTKDSGRLSLSSPLQGKVDIEASDAEDINHELSDLAKDTLITFGSLWLDKPQTGMPGSGGSARVYQLDSLFQPPLRR